MDEDEYEDDEDDYDDAVKPQESRRARILRSALARRQRLAEKFSIRWGVKPMPRCSLASVWMMPKRMYSSTPTARP